MKEWAIWYDDGSRFDDEDGGPWHAPRTGIQVIAQKNFQMEWELVSHSDYYYYEESRRGWYIADLFTVWDHLLRARYPLILFGRMVTDEQFRQITLRVIEELPRPKTAWRRGTPSWLKGQ